MLNARTPQCYGPSMLNPTKQTLIQSISCLLSCNGISFLNIQKIEVELIAMLTMMFAIMKLHSHSETIRFDYFSWSKITCRYLIRIVEMFLEMANTSDDDSNYSSVRFSLQKT